MCVVYIGQAFFHTVRMFAPGAMRSNAQPQACETSDTQKVIFLA
jgi:hypothetical protein